MLSQSVSAEQSAWWRLPRVIEETGLSRATIYRLMDRGNFPRNRAIRSTRVKVWLENEVRAWKRRELDDTDQEPREVETPPEPDRTAQGALGDLL